MYEIINKPCLLILLHGTNINVNVLSLFMFYHRNTQVFIDLNIFKK